MGAVPPFFLDKNMKNVLEYFCFEYKQNFILNWKFCFLMPLIFGLSRPFTQRLTSRQQFRYNHTSENPHKIAYKWRFCADFILSIVYLATF